MLILQRNDCIHGSTSILKNAIHQYKECIKSIYKDIERSPRYLSVQKFNQ